MCVNIKCACTHVLTGARGLGLPLCDWDRTRRVWVTWANGFMVMAPHLLRGKAAPRALIDKPINL